MYPVDLLCKRVRGALNFRGDHVFVGCSKVHAANVGPHDIACNPTIDGRICHAVATQSVRPVRAACVFSGDIQTFHRSPRVDIHDDTTHKVMRRWHDLDLTRSQIKTTVGTPFDHAFELLAHVFRPEMRHGDEDTFLIRVVVLSHFRIDAAADHISGRAFALGIVVKHEPRSGVVQKLSTCAAQPLFQDSPGHSGVVACQEPRWMELHHFHVAQRQACAQGHRKAIHRLVA